MPYGELYHYGCIMMAMASQITGGPIVYSTICSGADQRKHQSSAWLAFVRGIHRWPFDSPHKGPITRKIFPSDDVITIEVNIGSGNCCFPEGNKRLRAPLFSFPQVVLWYSDGITLTRSSHELNAYHVFLYYTFRIITAYPRGQWFTVDQIWNHKSPISQHGDLTVAATWVVI